jgi:hypothetical protein
MKEISSMDFPQHGDANEQPTANGGKQQRLEIFLKEKLYSVVHQNDNVVIEVIHTHTAIFYQNDLAMRNIADVTSPADRSPLKVGCC